MDGNAGPVVGIDGQAGDVGVGDVAGGSIIHGLDPARLASILERMLDAQQQLGLRMSVLERTMTDFQLADAQERYTRQKETDKRHAIEQTILVDAFDGVRDQIAEVRTWQLRQAVIIAVVVVVVALVVFFGWQAVYGAGLAVAAGLAARILGR